MKKSFLIILVLLQIASPNSNEQSIKKYSQDELKRFFTKAPSSTMFTTSKYKQQESTKHHYSQEELKKFFTESSTSTAIEMNIQQKKNSNNNECHCEQQKFDWSSILNIVLAMYTALTAITGSKFVAAKLLRLFCISI